MINDKSSLIDKIEYYMEYPGDESTLKNIFTEEELDILYTMSEFERMEAEVPQKRGRDASEEVEIFLTGVDREKEISFRLKQKFMYQMDILLGKGSIEAWIEITAWYHLLKNKKLIIESFWEFPVLENMLKIFKEEAQNMENSEISILGIRNMKELTEVYFRMVFMIRRMAYGAEVTDEILDYVVGRKLFPVFIKVMAEDSKIEIQDRETLLHDLSVRRYENDS